MRNVPSQSPRAPIMHPADGASDPPATAQAQIDTTLKAESILIEEFKHASASAHDARQGRANLFYIYILGVGALVTFAGALFGLYSSTQNYDLLVLSITVLPSRGYWAARRALPFC